MAFLSPGDRCLLFHIQAAERACSYLLLNLRGSLFLCCALPMENVRVLCLFVFRSGRPLVHQRQQEQQEQPQQKASVPTLQQSSRWQSVLQVSLRFFRPTCSTMALSSFFVSGKCCRRALSCSAVHQLQWKGHKRRWRLQHVRNAPVASTLGGRENTRKQRIRKRARHPPTSVERTLICMEAPAHPKCAYHASRLSDGLD